MHREGGETIRLGDGRHLGYSEYGDPGGIPVFYLHGFLGSRLEAALSNGPALRLRVRLIAPDRPGYGLSDPWPGHSLPDVARDVAELADHLAIERFSVLGVSGGAPTALAAARDLRGRLGAAAVVCGLGPLTDPDAVRAMPPPARVSISLARHAPGVLRALYAGIARPVLRRWPRYVLSLVDWRGCAPDRAVLAREEICGAILGAVQEALRPGPHGGIDDMLCYAREWGFSLSEVRTPVQLWHGELDQTVPIALARRTAQALPNCRARFIPDEGHFSLPVNHMEAVLASLTNHSRPGPG